jgi:hypothetical protein
MNGTPKGQRLYPVICPDCNGGMFMNGAICSTCWGDGRLLIPEDSHKPGSRQERALRIVIFVAIVLLSAISVVVTR